MYLNHIFHQQHKLETHAMACHSIVKSLPAEHAIHVDFADETAHKRKTTRGHRGYQHQVGQLLLRQRLFACWSLLTQSAPALCNV